MKKLIGIPVILVGLFSMMNYSAQATVCYKEAKGGYVIYNGQSVYACPRPDADSSCLQGIDCPVQ